jgi:hypothetical protein
MIKNTIQLMTESKVIAQSLTPIDTGNLRYNAITSLQDTNRLPYSDVIHRCVLRGNIERIRGAWG